MGFSFRDGVFTTMVELQTCNNPRLLRRQPPERGHEGAVLLRFLNKSKHFLNKTMHNVYDTMKSARKISEIVGHA